MTDRLMGRSYDFLIIDDLETNSIMSPAQAQLLRETMMHWYHQGLFYPPPWYIVRIPGET